MTKGFFYYWRWIFCIVISLLIISNSFAKSVNLFEHPNIESKILASMDSERGVIVIYSPKKSEWTKVADPSSGNIGWIKNFDLLDNSAFHFKIL